MARGNRKKPKRRGYVRPSRAAPKTGWSLRELAALTGSTPRAIRLYLLRGALPRPQFKGTATRYQRRHLVWLVAIRRLLATEGLSLAEIRTRLQALSAPELDAFALENLPPGPVADALGVQRYPAAAIAPLTSGVTAQVLVPAPRWARLQLALGLELHVCEDASPQVIALARRVRELCVAG